MKRTAKRGMSLEERLMKVRESSAGPDRGDPAEAPIEKARTEANPAPEPPLVEPVVAAPVASPIDFPPDVSPRPVEISRAALSATEGDTFLPAGAVPPAFALAVAATENVVLPDPPVPPEPPELPESSDDAVGRAEHAAADKADETNAPSTWRPFETAPEPPASEHRAEASSQLSTRLIDRWTGTTRKSRHRVARDEPATEADPALAAIPSDGPVSAAPEEPVAPAVPERPLASVDPSDTPTDNPTEIPIQDVEAGSEPHVAVRQPAEQNAAAESATTVDDGAPWTSPRTSSGQFGRVGATLIERGLVTHDQLDRALELQRSSGGRVGEILVGLGVLSPFELARVLADHLGVPFTDLRAKPPDALVAGVLPEEVARRYNALAVARWNDQLVIAMANPTDLFALDDLQMVTRQPIIPAMAVEDDLRAAIDRVYRNSIVETTLDAAASDYKASDLDVAANTLEVNEGPIVGLVNALMGQAITDQASDLHIEPCSTHVAIRLRIDGVLHDYSQVPLELLRPLVSRVKILGSLDIAQNRLAQDGRFSLTIQGRSVDVRVVTMPTAAGESAILRLLDPVRDTLGVSSLGLGAAEYARFMPAFQASQGAVFIVGPTGSGKTSTVYAVLSEINARSKSIVSVEDPVEFRLDGVKQIQVNPRVGLTFPTTLPSVLRADPDIVFIGEVRDTETARIAADASITGHLVLSTLHATRAAAAPMRLIEMGVEPYLVASALTLVASQRLARKLCDHCAAPAEATARADLQKLGADDALLDGAAIRRPVGCPACRNTGYRGRLPIFEIMPVTEGVSRLILGREPRARIERLAVAEGMETLHHAALRRVARGELSIEEMLRIIS